MALHAAPAPTCGTDRLHPEVVNTPADADETGASATEVLFSVITTTFNCVQKIDATVQSVLSQVSQNWEYLLIDGGSSDGTLEKIRSYAGPVRWISEPDQGIYDAMNKGVGLASGKFIYFLGAGDRMRGGILEAVANEIGRLSKQERTGKPIFLYGNVNWPRHPKPYDGPFDRFKLLKRNVCHQAIFYQRSVFERLGVFNTRYPSVADWEFNIRCFNDRGIATRYMPVLVADYEGGGASENTLDTAFLADFQTLKSKQYGSGLTLLMHLGFLLAHPRALIREPWRQGRRWLDRRMARRDKVP